MFGQRQMPKTSGCPHDTSRCPLYLAAHVADAGGSCMTGDWERGCAVDRGASFDKIFRKLTVRDFALMYGFTCRGMIGPGNEPLKRIWPWLFL